MKKLLTIILITILPLAVFSQEKIKEKKEKRVNYVFIPIVSYNPSFGFQAGFMANGLYDLNKKDTISPPSMTGVMFSYFSNKTLFAGVFSRNYFDNDNWRTEGAIVHGDINFQTYVFDYQLDLPEIGTEQHPSGEFYDYNTNFSFVGLTVMRRVVGHFYLGALARYVTTKTEFEHNLKPTETTELVGIGIASTIDTRDNVMNPRLGLNTKLKTFSYLEALGSSTQYTRILLEYNHYFKLTNNSIILGRYYSIMSVSNEEVPFSGQNTIGRDDLRGYAKGEHRANMVHDIQMAYRWNFYKKWGLVAFGGIGVAANDFKFEGDDYSGILPAAGFGIRYKVIPKRNLNIGIDVAAGKNDWGLYFRIGEAFTR